MSSTGEAIGAVHAGEGLEGLQHFYPLDESVSGYGIAAHMAPSLITCRLFNLHTGEMLADSGRSGDFAALSGRELVGILTEGLDALAKDIGVPLSKFGTAVVSGTTSLESRVTGFSASQIELELDEELLEYGRDIEYMLAGSNAIAVGHAFFAPCLDSRVGGDILCSLLAADILACERPLLFVYAYAADAAKTVLVYGNRESLSICVPPEGVCLDDALARFLGLCEARYENIEHVLFAGEVDMPPQLKDRMRRVPDAAIEGASAILLSEMAEDELCRITSACRIVEI